MTGPSNSVIGIEKEMIIEKYLTLMPRRFEVAKGRPVLSAAVVEINELDGKALSIERLLLRDG